MFKVKTVIRNLSQSCCCHCVIYVITQSSQAELNSIKCDRPKHWKKNTWGKSMSVLYTRYLFGPQRWSGEIKLWRMICRKTGKKKWTQLQPAKKVTTFLNAYITQRKVRLNISRNKIKILIVNCFAVPLLLHDITPKEHILH